MDKGPCPEGGRGAVAWASFEELGDRQREVGGPPVPFHAGATAPRLLWQRGRAAARSEQPPRTWSRHTCDMRVFPKRAFLKELKKNTPAPTLALWVRRVMGTPWNKSVRAGGSSQGPSAETGAEVEQGTVWYHQATVSNVNSSSKEAGGHLFWERLTP